MSGFPVSPRLLKGAIAGGDSLNPLANVLVFQSNPHTPMRPLARKSIRRHGGSDGGL